MEDLSVELWSTLRPELVERTLSFLSVPVLCRFRTVCKRWNSLICTPEFRVLCTQHARRGVHFIVVHEEKGWSLLDLSARRWYSIQHDELEIFGGWITIGAVAMDGGLVCQHLYANGRGDAAVYVSNPITKTSRRLPSCTAIAASVRPVVDMVVDNSAHNYKIFLIPNGPHGERVSAEKPFMAIYESTTNQWRNSTILQTPLIGFSFRATSSVFLDGLLYVLMSPSDTTLIAQHDCLWSYNHVEDVWKNTCVNIHKRAFHYPQLIVSDNRLFLASWMQKLPDAQDQSDVRLSYATWPWAQDGWSYEISEVHLGDRTCSTVFEMTEAGMRQVLEVPGIVERRFSSVHLKAFGCCKSLVLLCMSTGMSIEYDLSSSLWRMLPCKPMRKPTNLIFRDSQECREVGKPMNLTF